MLSLIQGSYDGVKNTAYNIVAVELNKRPCVGRRVLNGFAMTAGLACLIMAVFMKCNWNVDFAQHVLEYGKWVAVGSAAVAVLHEIKCLKDGYNKIIGSISYELKWNHKLGLVIYHDYCPIDLSGTQK